jgi:UPF0176 protein
MHYRAAAFYQFISLLRPTDLREPLHRLCAALELKGTILLANEGINGTVAGTAAAINQFVGALQNGTPETPVFRQLELKFSNAGSPPFQRLKVRLKKEIVALGKPAADPTKSNGVYVEPVQWNALLADPDILLIDTRNDFEVTAGTFPGAVNPHTSRFSYFPTFVEENLDPHRHKKIAMFCTGGIRCEKASAYLLSQGFAEIYQLKGGILKYLETIPQSQSRWQGDCFVFDERVALSHHSFERL